MAAAKGKGPGEAPGEAVKSRGEALRFGDWSKGSKGFGD